MPDVSILIPCHNAAPWLEKAIASALACRHAAEVIVVDDGSSDGSDAIAAAFGPRITLLRQPQAGGNAARNRLVAAARCEWLQFLDADDYLEPDKLERQFAEAEPLANRDVLYSPVWEETWRDGRPVARRQIALEPETDLFTQWISWQLPQTGGVLWRAEALRRIGGWNEAMACCQEHELYLRALQRGLRWKFCPSPGAVYRVWSETTVSRRDHVRVITVRSALIDQMLLWLATQKQLTPHHRQTAARACFEMARTWARTELTAAAGYHDERRRQGLISLTGPAAPWTFVAAYRLLGFRGAEKLAKALR